MKGDGKKRSVRNSMILHVNGVVVYGLSYMRRARTVFSLSLLL